jgi:hypothetical protein
MKYEIKKVNENDAVIILSEEIKINDWVIDLETNTLFQVKEQKLTGIIRSDTDTFIEDACKKIIATISPFKIEGLPMLELPNPAYDWFASKSYLEQHSLSDKYFESRHPSLLTNEQVTEMYKLELPSQEEDVRLLALKMYPVAEVVRNITFDDGVIERREIEDVNEDLRDGFIAGYKVAQNKKYSEVDIRNALWEHF